MYFDVLKTNSSSLWSRYAQLLTTQRQEPGFLNLWDFKRIKIFQLLQILVCDFLGLSEGRCKYGKVPFNPFRLKVSSSLV